MVFALLLFAFRIKAVLRLNVVLGIPNAEIHKFQISIFVLIDKVNFNVAVRSSFTMQ